METQGGALTFEGNDPGAVFVLRTGGREDGRS